MAGQVLVPKRVFLTNGVGRHAQYLQSFEAALRDGGIEKYNLVYVSGILPPGCDVVRREEGLGYMKPGQIIYCVMSRNETNEPGRQIAAAIGIARPRRTGRQSENGQDLYGYIAECHDFGITDEAAKDKAEDLAATMLASTLGIDFDPEAAWDQREEVYKASRRIFDPRSVVQSARGDKDGRWTTVLAAAVFCDYCGDEKAADA